MTQNMMEELRREVDELNTYILDNKAKVDGGEAVIIDGLDIRVTELCKKIQTLPDDEHASFQVHLEGMVKNLDGLMDSLNTMQQNLKSEMQSPKTDTNSA